jgi:ATPase subunit of ABC transporter with duplicated ATPase domains
MDTIDALVKALHDFQGGVMMVSHDEQFIMSTCNEVWVCDGAGGNHGTATTNTAPGVRRVESLVAYKEGILASMKD